MLESESPLIQLSRIPAQAPDVRIVRARTLGTDHAHQMYALITGFLDHLRHGFYE